MHVELRCTIEPWLVIAFLSVTNYCLIHLYIDIYIYIGTLHWKSICLALSHSAIIQQLCWHLWLLGVQNGLLTLFSPHFSPSLVLRPKSEGASWSHLVFSVCVKFLTWCMHMHVISSCWWLCRDSMPWNNQKEVLGDESNRFMKWFYPFHAFSKEFDYFVATW